MNQAETHPFLETNATTFSSSNSLPRTIYLNSTEYKQMNNINYYGVDITETITYRWCLFIDQVAMRAYRFRLKNSTSFLSSVLQNKPMVDISDFSPAAKLTNPNSTDINSVNNYIDNYMNTIQQNVTNFLKNQQNTKPISNDIEIYNKVSFPEGQTAESMEGYIPEVIEVTYEIKQ